MVTQNYDLPRTESSTDFDTTWLVFLVPQGTTPPLQAPIMREIRDLLDEIEHGHLASGGSRNRVLVLDDSNPPNLDWELIKTANIADEQITNDLIAQNTINAADKLVANSITEGELDDLTRRKLPTVDPQGQADGQFVVVQNNRYRLQTGGADGQPGADGASATVEVVYLRNNDSDAPATPVGSNPAGWSSTALLPTTSARYVWRALRSGTVGSLSAWMVTLASYLAPAGAKGDQGDAGAGLTVKYRATATTTTPSDPTVAPGDWSDNLVVPTNTSPYAWAAWRLGTGSWMIFVISNVVVTPPSRTDQRYITFSATQGFNAAEFTSGNGVSIPTGTVTGTLSGATADSYVKIWAERPLTEVTNTLLTNPDTPGNPNILSDHFTAAASQTVNSVVGNYYESTTTFNQHAINHEWTVR